MLNRFLGRRGYVRKAFGRSRVALAAAVVALGGGPWALGAQGAAAHGPVDMPSLTQDQTRPTTRAVRSSKWEGCHEMVAFITVPEENVRERVPARFRLALAPTGDAIVFIRTAKCEAVRIAGDAGPATVAQFAAVIQPPSGKHGCFDEALEHYGLGALREASLAPYCQWYVFFWTSDSRDLIKWLRTGTPGYPARYVRDLTYDYRPALVPLGWNFRARAGAPAPSPFAMRAIAPEGLLEGPGEGNAYWAMTRRGTVRITVRSPAVAFGEVPEGEIEAAPGSEMARMFGAETRGFPGASLFLSGSFETATYIKEIVPPPQGRGSQRECSAKCRRQLGAAREANGQVP